MKQYTLRACIRVLCFAQYWIKFSLKRIFFLGAFFRANTYSKLGAWSNFSLRDLKSDFMFPEILTQLDGN